MIPKLTPNDKLNMTLGQINRYEKKYTKLSKDNRYYLQHYNYDVSLNEWSIHVDAEGYINARGNLENGNFWITSDIKDLKSCADHYCCTTQSGTIYRLYFDSVY
jgi:hypothetical protein